MPQYGNVVNIVLRWQLCLHMLMSLVIRPLGVVISQYIQTYRICANVSAKLAMSHYVTKGCCERDVNDYQGT